MTRRESRELLSRREVLAAGAAAIPAISDAEERNMELGTFSVSLAVKDLAALKFYEKLGLRRFAGDPSRRYVILKNGDATIGLLRLPSRWRGAKRGPRVSW